MLFVIIASGFLGTTLAGSTVNPVNCTGMDDGYAFFGCKAAHVCRGTQSVYVECGPDEAFNEQSGSCTNQASVTNPCNLRDLERYQDQCASTRPGPGAHRFPIDYEENGLNCQYFFVCWQQQFIGIQKCQGGVFDERKQYCSSEDRVAPPCGKFQAEDTNQLGGDTRG